MNRSNPSRNRGSTWTAGWAAALAVAAGWWHTLVQRFRTALMPGDPERGDVPGWVMITLMSAILVAGLLVLVQPALERMFESAIEQVQP